ncbi:MAG TPA: ATP-binding protein [Polyangiales bacterium]
MAVDATEQAAEVLIVDDNAGLAENVAELFVLAGHRARAFTDPRAACAAASATAFDLAVVDVRLPNQSGVDLAAELKGLCPDAEIILMTANATVDTAIAAVSQGAFAYVQKPFDPAELMALGNRALKQVHLGRERLRLLDELARSETVYRGVVESVDAFIVSVDAQGTVQMWNRSVAEATGWLAADALRRSLASFLVSVPARHQLSRAIERALAGEVVANLELSLRTRAGAQRIVRWRFSRFSFADRHEPMVLAVGADLTDRLELERRAAEAEAMASLGTLTAGLAHEIRNPLNAATLQLELLSRSADKLPDPKLKERIDARVAIVKEELARLTNLLSDFLNLAKPKSLHLGPVDVGLLFKEVLTLEEPAAKSAGVTLLQELDEGPHLVRGDHPTLKQVLVNLVLNAIEAQAGQPDACVKITCHGQGDSRIELRVEDQGPGIPVEVAQKLFTPFVTSKEAGTGLGLTIVKRIIDRHGGTVHIGSGDPRGTVVRITLQRAATPTRVALG